MRRVLVIEDDESIRELTKLTLEMIDGWDVVTAENGSIGLALAHLHLPDVILLDLQMPDMDGVEVFKHLRANPRTRDIPVILLTASAQPRAAIQPPDGPQFDAVFAKPYDALTLGAQVRAVLGWKDAAPA